MVTRIVADVGRLLQLLSVSTEAAIVIAAASVILTAAVLSGHASRLTAWIQDLSHRFARSRAVGS